MKRHLFLIFILFNLFKGTSQNETTINVTKEVVIDTSTFSLLGKQDISYQFEGIYYLHAVILIQAIKDKISSKHIQSVYIKDDQIYFFENYKKREKFEKLLSKRESAKNQRKKTEYLQGLESKSFVFIEETYKKDNLKFHYTNEDDYHFELINSELIIKENIILNEKDTVFGLNYFGSSLIQSTIYDNTLSICKLNGINPYDYVHKSYKTPKRIEEEDGETFYEILSFNFENLESKIKYYRRELITQNHGPYKVEELILKRLQANPDELGIFNLNDSLIAKLKKVRDGILIYDKTNNCFIVGSSFKEHDMKVFWE